MSSTHRRQWPGRRTVAGAAAAVTVAATALVVAVVPDANAAISPTAWYTVANKNSGKCVDARAAGTANGTAVQQTACNSTNAQQWQVQPTSDGHVRVNNRGNAAQVWDVAEVSSVDGGVIHLWTYGGGNNQQWQPVEEADGAYHFVSRHSGKCLDVPAASTADGVQLQQYTCNGTAAQSFRLTPVGGPIPTSSPTDSPGPAPDLGPNVSVFDPSMSSADDPEPAEHGLPAAGDQPVRTEAVRAAVQARHLQRGRQHRLLHPGRRPRLLPRQRQHQRRRARRGRLVPAATPPRTSGATAENLSVNPTGGTDRWAVSQARRTGGCTCAATIQLDDGGWSSGGFMSDTKIDGQVRSGSQQQWLSRNSQWSSWTGSNWNMVFVGAVSAPAGNFPNPPYTRVAQTPTVREKPFLYVDQAGGYRVFVPALRTNSRAPPGRTAPQPASRCRSRQFYIVKAGATAATINARSRPGKNLLVTPGVYQINDTIRDHPARHGRARARAGHVPARERGHRDDGRGRRRRQGRRPPLRRRARSTRRC